MGYESTSECRDGSGTDRADEHTQRPASRMAIRLRRLLQRLREFNATNIELHERIVLRNEPWREGWLHWSYDGHTWHLHGHVLPPVGERNPSVTGSGWCPGLRFATAR